jgi:hypothetical protein
VDRDEPATVRHEPRQRLLLRGSELAAGGVEHEAGCRGGDIHLLVEHAHAEPLAGEEPGSDADGLEHLAGGEDRLEHVIPIQQDECARRRGHGSSTDFTKSGPCESMSS